jgi:hypothetical protein
MYRVIATSPKEVEGTDTGVSIDACQLPDGSFVNGPIEYPAVRVDRCSTCPGYEWEDCLELTAAGARQLARALFRAADQLGEWEGTGSA